mmetsp:Transcript_42623/g.66756  ORF Transcript_42623/g.66756 Transcript_42623/m.66756 type:complete len:119 (+) Transcript_42623:388-744(+)
MKKREAEKMERIDTHSTKKTQPVKDPQVLEMQGVVPGSNSSRDDRARAAVVVQQPKQAWGGEDSRVKALGSMGSGTPRPRRLSGGLTLQAAGEDFGVRDADLDRMERGAEDATSCSAS